MCDKKNLLLDKIDLMLVQNEHVQESLSDVESTRIIELETEHYTLELIKNLVIKTLGE